MTRLSLFLTTKYVVSSLLDQLVGQKTFCLRLDRLCTGHVLSIFVRAKLRSEKQAYDSRENHLKTEANVSAKNYNELEAKN